MRRRTSAALIVVILAIVAAVPAFAQRAMYWEPPRVFVPQNMEYGSSAAGAAYMALAWQEVQPRSASDKTSGNIFLSLAVSSDGANWTPHPRFFSPIRYSGVTAGSEPRVYSMVVDSQDRLYVAVAVSNREVVVLQSADQGASFKQLGKVSSRASVGVPNLFTTAAGGLLLLLSQGSSDATAATGSVNLVYSMSRDGTSWSPLAPLVSSSDGVGSPQLQPSHASWRGQEFVAFEALTTRSDLTSSWQVYVVRSSNDGAAWQKAVPLTTSVEPLAGQQPFGADPLAFDNERPRLTPLQDTLGVVWERSPYGTSDTKIWLARLDEKGALSAAPEVVSAATPARFAQVVRFRGGEYVIYSDASSGTSRITLSQKSGGWQPLETLQNTDPALSALFPTALQFRNSLHIFWENLAATGGLSSLVQIRPLTSVGAPVVRPVDFTPGQPTNRDTVTINLSEPQPPDPSGIVKYRYSLTFSDGVTTVEKERGDVDAPGGPLPLTRKVDKDGTWTFSVWAKDVAGNETTVPAVVSFVRDGTPPKPVSFEVTAADGTPVFSAPPVAPENRDLTAHAVPTNSFTVRWIPGGDKDIVGYTYNLQQGWASLSDYEQSTVPLLAPPARVVTVSTDIAFNNRDNGVYVLTVRALDRAGNLSPPSTLALGLSGYVVVTRVDLVTTRKDQLGTLAVTILGRGFRDNGPVTKVFLDRGHRSPPWDIELDPSALAVTDRQISGITLGDNRETGSYRVGILQQRPSGQAVLYFTPGPMFEFTSPGTVKIGNFQLLLPTWVAGPSPQYLFSFNALLVVLIVAFLAALSVLAFRKIVAVAQEGVAVRAEVMALLEGRPNPRWEERKRRMQELKRRGIGLRLKFTLLMVILVTMIVLIVSIPLGFQMVNRQRVSLASGLQNSANILMGALASSAEIQFLQKEQGFFGAADMPNLRSTMPEAVYTTISGPDANFRPTDPKDWVWASDQKRFADELKAVQFRIAAEKVDDDLARTVIPALQKKIDSEGMAKLMPLLDQFRTLQGQSKDLQRKTDAASRAQLTAVGDQLAQVSRDINLQAKNLYAVSGTLEPFDPAGRLLPSYLFYRPVIFYNRADNLADSTFYQGMIRLQVRTDAINRQIDDAISGIIRTAGLIALGAIALGILGAVLMASITVTPIRRLARGVAVIRDTEDKEDLHDHVIRVRTRDEIGSLAETVNEMTQGLVKAARANKMLLEGIDVQKRFLPLVKNRSGEASSTAEEENSRMEIFGYYKGAKGVSGDYFDFKRLDDTYYALIKCDVSGKGVAAALIMVEVATLFINYFQQWPKRKENIARLASAAEKQKAQRELERLEPLVYTINDMLEERGFSGKFAALTVCLFNSATGTVTICNAGDTVANLYNAEKKSMVHVQLPSSPAAGSIASMLVEMKSPYRQVQQKLGPGDVLFLNTDGFEESKRPMRGPDFKLVEGGEDFSGARIDAVFNAVFTRGRYVLSRAGNPIPDEELVFDFSSCKGTVKEAVLALVAVEKVYRMSPNPLLGRDDKVTIEEKVAEFLKDHFIQYPKYFGHPVDGEQKGILSFTNAFEDEQYDDLTIIALRRK
jgi:serine phosphatase RsbU (regulator of sigma subunit)